jgi:hypothetical protein
MGRAADPGNHAHAADLLAAKVISLAKTPNLTPNSPVHEMEFTS